MSNVLGYCAKRLYIGEFEPPITNLLAPHAKKIDDSNNVLRGYTMVIRIPNLQSLRTLFYVWILKRGYAETGLL